MDGVRKTDPTAHVQFCSKISTDVRALILKGKIGKETEMRAPNAPSTPNFAVFPQHRRPFRSAYLCGEGLLADPLSLWVLSACSRLKFIPQYS